MFALFVVGGCVNQPSEPPDPGGGGKADAPCANDPTGVLATQQVWPSSIVVDQTRVYWATTDGTIAATHRCHGGAVDVLAIGQASPRGIAVDDANLYWVNYASGGDGAVMAMAKTSGTIASLATVRGPIGLALANTDAYVLALDGVYRVPLVGGAAVLVAPVTCPHGSLAVAGDDVLWSEDCVMFGAPRIVRFAAGVASTFVADEAPQELAVDDGHAYWTTWAIDGPRVRTIALSGGAPTTIATLSGYANSIAADANHVYIGGEKPGGDRAVLVVPRDGSVPAAVVATATNAISSVCAYDGVVYFASQGQAGTIHAALTP
ncbi:MAG: hypothetical protein ACKV2T_19910 [Kofleriaceae bacterium]